MCVRTHYIYINYPHYYIFAIVCEHTEYLLIATYNMILKDTGNFDMDSIVQSFCMDGKIVEIRGYGSGHINDTFLLVNKDLGSPDYLLQRINHYVFKDVPGLINNIDLVTAHLKKKMPLGLGENVNQKVLSLIPAKDGKLFYKDEDGNYWRVYLFLSGSRSYDIVSTEIQARECGKAFGFFQSLLSDMNPQLLSETIADFHNIHKRLADFHQAVEQDSMNRLSSLSAEVQFITEREQAMSVIYQWGQAGLLPKRITHNDTKFNNVLFDQNDKVKCVIDLDTVMAGYVAYDFGDAIRTIINSASEDEPDLYKIQLNMHLFKAYTQGYINKSIDFLEEKEIESLYHGVMLFPYMQGVRFLTDYLQGDTYYKIAYPEHNLIRTKAQLQLLVKLEEQSEAINQIISEAVTANKTIHKEKVT